MIPLIVGMVLALVGLAFVLYPLFADPGAVLITRRNASWSDTQPAAEDAVAALREVEFDRATGKLSDADYDALRARYTERALAEMRARDSMAAAAEGAATPVDQASGAVNAGDMLDVAEAAVRRKRERMTRCVSCGPRPEADALYCSGCGRFLPGCCAGCGAAVTEPGARFCPGCGSTLAA